MKAKKSDDENNLVFSTPDVFGASSLVRPLYKNMAVGAHSVNTTNVEALDFKSIKDTKLRNKAKKLLSLIEDTDSFELSQKIHECIDIIIRDDALITAQKNLEKRRKDGKADSN